MPPLIPETCGKWTCDHEGPNSKQCKIWRINHHYLCQQPRGRCEIHDKPQARTKAVAEKIAARSREYLFRDRVDTPTPEEVEQRVKTEVLDALPTDDVLALTEAKLKLATQLLSELHAATSHVHRDDDIDPNCASCLSRADTRKFLNESNK